MHLLYDFRYIYFQALEQTGPKRVMDAYDIKNMTAVLSRFNKLVEQLKTYSDS